MGGWKIALKFNRQGVLKKLLNSATFSKTNNSKKEKTKKKKNDYSRHL